MENICCIQFSILECVATADSGLNWLPANDIGKLLNSDYKMRDFTV